MLQAVRSAEIITPDGPRAGALLLENDHILGICNHHEIPSHALLHDVGTDALLPGLVDTHVHINEPGRTDWEGFRTATRAAAAGGFTTLVDMPLNCLPETTTVAALTAKRRAATAQCHVDWLPWGGVVATNQPHLAPLARAGVPGFKCFLIYPGCEGFTSVNHAELEASLPTLARLGLPLLVHAELADPIDAATADLRARNADWTLYSTYLASRPDHAETAAIALLLDLCRQYRFRLHIVHLSSALALPLLRHARAEGLPVTVETCPHYLVFAAEDIPTGNTLFKCAPPIRSRENCNHLWQALADGTIDLIATDHSPCPPDLKHLDPAHPDHGRFDLAWGGIASLSVALAATWTEAARRGHTLTDIARWMSSAPAALAGFSSRAGALAPGREATFTVFRSTEPWTPTPADLHTRHPISPFLGRPLLGQVQRTVLRGTTVFDRTAPDPFPGPPRGTDLSLPPAVC